MTDDQSLTGRIIRVHSNRFIVQTADGLYECILRGKLRLVSEHEAAPVVVGDRVKLTVLDRGKGAIEDVAERKTKLSRPDVANPGQEQVIVANLEQMIVVASVEKPRLKPGVIDRFLLAAEKNGIKGCVCINKIDLARNDRYLTAVDGFVRAGYATVLCSAVTGQGIDQLRNLVQYRLSFLVGHSGVGKSTIINALQSGLEIKTSEISTATGKGVHTTSVVELHPLDFGGYIADSPGLREVGLWDIAPQELASYYPEMQPYLGQCRFRNCAHLGEPGCAVKEAVDRGEICPRRFDGYHRIYRSL